MQAIANHGEGETILELQLDKRDLFFLKTLPLNEVHLHQDFMDMINQTSTEETKGEAETAQARPTYQESRSNQPTINDVASQSFDTLSNKPCDRAPERRNPEIERAEGAIAELTRTMLIQSSAPDLLYGETAMTYGNQAPTKRGPARESALVEDLDLETTTTTTT